MDFHEFCPTPQCWTSILWCWAFFIVQLSHPYLTTGKTTALTRCAFVSKIMSLCFNVLSNLVMAFLPRSKCLIFMASVTICGNFGAKITTVGAAFTSAVILGLGYQSALIPSQVMLRCSQDEDHCVKDKWRLIYLESWWLRFPQIHCFSSWSLDFPQIYILSPFPQF